jgi:hypothetical protein
MPISDWTPSLSDVGIIDIARTRDDVGTETGTFTSETRPTDDQVLKLIDFSVLEIVPKIGNDIPAELFQEARNLVAIRTAMWIELTYYAAEVAQNRSPYPEYKKMFDEQLPSIVASIESVEAGGDPADNTTGNFPQFGFPAPTNWMEGKM